MAYASACDVYALTPGLVKPASMFDTATCPSLTEVNAWLTTGCSVINTQLAMAGYGAVSASSAAYGLVTQANALFGAWFAERSRINARVSGDERTRADMFKRDFEALMKMIVGEDLDLAGVGILDGAIVGSAYAGGISAGDKAVVASNTDRVSPRFSRGMGQNPERGSGSNDQEHS